MLLDRLRRSRLKTTSADAAEDYVRMAYKVLLRREIDPAGLHAWRTQISAGRFQQQHVIDALLASEEYQVRFGINLIGIVHQSRQTWIATLPAYESILDIGGSSPDKAEGAMIVLGYPHRPRTLDIVDLPPDDQYWGKPKFDQSVPHRFDWGEVNYYHARAERIGDVAALRARSYDAVFMGQAIEHVYPEALPSMLAWVRAHLRPNGRFVFDTPNRLLTKIQCPNSLIDPDHKYEYAPSEMEGVLNKAGFSVTRRVGMVHLPRQAASGQYEPREFVGAPLLSNDVDACYLFAFEANVESSVER
jgi:hypothetical protein